MPALTDLTVPYQDLFRSSYNLGFHPAILLGDSMNLDGQRAIVQTPLDYLGYTAPQSIENVNMAPNSIADWNIQNFSFNKGQGGTLTLGGANNINGVLTIEDAQGNVILRGDTTGLNGFDAAGIQHFFLDGALGRLTLAGNTGNTVVFKDTVNGTIFGLMGYEGTQNVIQLGASNGKNLTLAALGANASLIAGNTVLVGSNSGDVNLTAVSGNITNTCVDFKINGVSKAAIVPTSNGYREFYCTESPEVWFMDFCKSKEEIDPIFLEATEKPYHFIKCEDGEYQVWGKRKGFESVRMMEKTEEQFKKNVEFWNTPNDI